jgi:hypothetical protein
MSTAATRASWRNRSLSASSRGAIYGCEARHPYFRKVRIGVLVQLTPRVKPATKKRQGRNRATGEAITIAAKPASIELRVRPLAKANGALPSVQKVLRRLAA